VLFGGGLVAARALLTGFWVALIVGSLRGEPQGWQSIGPAMHRAVRRLSTLIGAEAGFLALAVLMRIVDLLTFGIGIGPLGTIAVLMGGVYFLVFVPIAVIVDDLDLRSAASRSTRAARIPGRQHLLLALGYVFVILVTQSISPVGRIAPATPTILIWIYGLFVSFVNMLVLAAFTYRWLAVHDSADVLERVAPRPPARRQPAGSGWLGRRSLGTG
jgi:hypothetical protein